MTSMDGIEPAGLRGAQEGLRALSAGIAAMGLPDRSTMLDNIANAIQPLSNISSSLLAGSQYNGVAKLVELSSAVLAQQERQMSVSLAPMRSALSRYAEVSAASLDFTPYSSRLAASVSDLGRQLSESSLTSLTGVASYQSSLAAATIAASPIQSLVSDSLASIGGTLAQYQRLTVPTGLQARLRLLEQGFEIESGTPADDFGRVLNATRRHPALSESLDAAIAATQRPGPFGADLGAFREQAARVADTFDEVASDSSLLEPLERLRQTTHLDDELLLAFGDRLGWWERIKTHRPFAAQIILSYTFGLTGFAVASGTGTSLPAALWDSIIAGGTIYFGMIGRGPKP